MAAALAGALVLAGAGPAAATTIVIDNMNTGSQGLNDPAPFSPGGGNPATTLGQARMNALQYAAGLWAGRLSSAVPIHVAAAFVTMSCSPTSAQLGSAGTMTVHSDFAGAPLGDTWYPQALANSLAGADSDSSNPDISANFSETLDGGTCLGGTVWYYGYDALPPAGKLDFVSVALHEMGHGLGFQTFVNLASGAKFMARSDAYMRYLIHEGATPSDYPGMSNAQRVAASTSDPSLQWSGPLLDADAAGILLAGMVSGRVRIHGPAMQQPGSSVSHFSTALSPNELMEPFYTGANHNLGLTVDLLRDLGWQIPPPPPPPGPFTLHVPSSGPGASTMLAFLLLGATGLAARARGGRIKPESARSSETPHGAPRHGSRHSGRSQ